MYVHIASVPIYLTFLSYILAAESRQKLMFALNGKLSPPTMRLPSRDRRLESLSCARTVL